MSAILFYHKMHTANKTEVRVIKEHVSCKRTDFINIFESVEGVLPNVISWYRIRMKLGLQICKRTDYLIVSNFN